MTRIAAHFLSRPRATAAAGRALLLLLPALLGACSSPTETGPEPPLAGTYTLVGTDSVSQGFSGTVTLGEESVFDLRPGSKDIRATGSALFRRAGESTDIRSLCLGQRREYMTSQGEIAPNERFLLTCTGAPTITIDKSFPRGTRLPSPFDVTATVWKLRTDADSTRPARFTVTRTLP
jgi:hypothetical protein